MSLASEFLLQLADRKYLDWALRHVVLQPTYTSAGRWNEARQLLVKALPSVITFNGVSGLEFPDIPDYMNFRAT